MSTQVQSKKDILKDKVVALVKDFIKTEGGITSNDLRSLFGEYKIIGNEITAALDHLLLTFNDHTQLSS